jgi:hypothetical protein
MCHCAPVFGSSVTEDRDLDKRRFRTIALDYGARPVDVDARATLRIVGIATRQTRPAADLFQHVGRTANRTSGTLLPIISSHAHLLVLVEIHSEV